MLADGGGDIRLASAWLLVGDFWASYKDTRIQHTPSSSTSRPRPSPAAAAAAAAMAAGVMLYALWIS